MRDYGYSGRHYSYKIPRDGVAVDLENRVLRVTAKYDGFGKPDLVEEFPLLLVRGCKKCGDPVTIYAAGSVMELTKKAKADLFATPWGYGNWTLLRARGGFGLVATSGHKFRTSVYGHDEATCRESVTRLAYIQGEEVTT